MTIEQADERYTLFHWGLYRVEQSGTRTVLSPYAHDPDPSAIGSDQLEDTVLRLRVRRPAIRRGWLDKSHPRADDGYVEVPWDEALDLVAGELRRVRDTFGNEAIFGGSYGWSSAGRFHHAQSQVHRFLNTLGGFVRHVDSYSLGAARVLMPHIVASIDAIQSGQTSWDQLAEHTQLFVAFGGLPLKNAQTSSGGVGDHRVRGALRHMAQKGVRFVNIGPVADNLESGMPVEWIPIRPNTDAALMLALAWVLDDEALCDRAFLTRCCVGHEAFCAYLRGETDGIPKTPGWAEGITGVPAARIAALAREMAAHRTMLNVAWSLQRASHGEQPYWGAVALAAMIGQIGTPGGGFGLGYSASNRIGSGHRTIAGPTLPQGRNPVSSFIPVARLTDMLLHPGEPFTYNGESHAYPDIRLVYWAGGNPYHHHQDLNRLSRAWEKPETIIVHEQFWTSTAKRADIVLPVTTSLERDDIGYATREGILVAMRQAASAFASSRSDFEIFSALSDRLGVADRFTEGLDAQGWLRRLYEESRKRSAPAVSLPDFDAFWNAGVVQTGASDKPVILLDAFRADPGGRPLPTPSGRIEIFSDRIARMGLADCPGHPAWLEPAEWLGSPKARDYPFHLLSDQPARRLHSQLDHSAHSQAGKIGGREPVYLNRGDAEARGIALGDTVLLFNERGRCLSAAIPSDDIAPGVA
ncbi:MAG: molybdopterin-dependent oxidoreductase, partial [Microvirga sp.]